MKIWKFELKKQKEQFVRMPEKSEILDIQMQHGTPVMWALCRSESKEIDVKINMYGTGWYVQDGATVDEYLSTVQDGGLVWHFFMNYEV